MKNYLFKSFVGVDVSKNRLDVFCSGTRQRLSLPNTAEGIANQFLLHVQSRETLVVMEATGGYETRLVQVLGEAGIAVAIVNPRRVRDFAKSLGREAKTDSIDAEVIARYGEVAKPSPIASKSDGEKKLEALVTRRSQLVDMITQESNRLRQTYDEEIKEDIRQILESLKKQRKLIEERLEKRIEMMSDPQLRRRAEILQSAKGIGQVATCTIIAELPELGTLNRGAIAKLVGLAPLNRDSGAWQGKRFISGGRSHVRRVLYMATLVAVRHNDRIRRYYQHLLSKGKAKKVAIVACMRKLLTILNVLIKNNELWTDEKSVSAV